MFTKVKRWFRDTVADEVGKVELSLRKRVDAVETSFEQEKALLVSAISVHAKSTLNGLENDVAQLLLDFEHKLVAEAALVVAEKNKLIEELHAKVAALEATTRKITQWKADDDTVAADHTLKVVK